MPDTRENRVIKKSALSRIDWRKYDIKNTPYYKHELPRNVKIKCLEINKTFGINYSCIDMALSPNGEYYFLELNPSGLWAWIEALTRLEISKEIANLLVENDK
jgi:glutathione synthase/RimK-type ligase-like ATP-grasp enzyme